MIRQLSIEGHKVTARIEGLAASIASVIACACDRVVMGESSLMMIHNCWSVVQGDSNTLRKEAETMDKINEAIISFYLSKFDQTREALKELMNQETWFSGKDAQTFKFNCEVTPDKSDFKIAAMVKGFDLGKFLNTPKALEEIIMEKEQEMKKQANDEQKEDVVETKTEETKVEEPVVEEPVVEGPKAEEPKEEVVEAEAQPIEEATEEPKAEGEMIAKAEADKRVSGMQSAMAKQMDAMKKDYEAKIADFEVQMKAKDEELTKARADVTSLTESLDNTTKELAEMTSAFKEKASALDALNASVNTPDEMPTMKEGLKNCKTPSEVVAFLKSGRYVR